jgi:hypothetical protein
MVPPDFPFESMCLICPGIVTDSSGASGVGKGTPPCTTMTAFNKEKIPALGAGAI